jgi:hypothetical protein
VEEESVALEAAARKEPKKERTPRVDQAELLRKTFDFDVLACVRCGGRRQVLAYLTAPSVPSVNYFFPLATITLPHRVDALTAFTSSSP